MPPIPPTIRRSPHRCGVWVASSVAAWLLVSLTILYSFNLGMPMALEQALSLLAAPALLALGAWTPLLRPLGLTTGQWWALPSPLGCALIIAIYSIGSYGLTRLVLRRWRFQG